MISSFQLFWRKFMYIYYLSKSNNIFRTHLMLPHINLQWTLFFYIPKQNYIRFLLSFLLPAWPALATVSKEIRRRCEISSKCKQHKLNFMVFACYIVIPHKATNLNKAYRHTDTVLANIIYFVHIIVNLWHYDGWFRNVRFMKIYFRDVNVAAKQMEKRS
jgi:hypothetical protein